MKYIVIAIVIFLSSCSDLSEHKEQPMDGFQSTSINTKMENDRYIIMFKKTKDSQLIRKMGGSVIRETKNFPIVISKLPEQAKRALEKNPNIQLIENDQRVELFSEVKDWGIVNTKSEQAWEYPYSGNGVKVAVLDTGIETTHEDITIQGGISYIEEINGDRSYTDYNGHGTHVAGIIGAKHNGLGIMGVSPDVELYNVKVLNADGAGYLSDIVAGIDWTITNQMDVINLSLGTGTYTETMEKVVNKAAAAGITVVAAAGNSGDVSGTGDTIAYPAKFESVIAVAATTKANVRASFSSTGPTLEIAAPGASILSSYLTNSYTRLNGTSMAAPFVTGIVALLKEAQPHWTSQEIRTYLRETSIDIGDPGFDERHGYGLIQFALPEPTSTLTLNQPVFESKESTHDKITINWRSVPDADSYIVKREGIVIYQGVEVMYTEHNLQPGKWYRYEISAVKGEVFSEPLEVVVGTKIRTPRLTFTKHDSSTIQFEWENLNEATDYRLSRNGQEIYLGSSRSFIERNLSYDSTYIFELVARGETGESSPSEVTITTQRFIPAKPTTLQGEAFEGGVDLHWTISKEENIAGYIIYLNGVRYNNTPLVETSARISPLTNGKTYMFTVTAMSNEGNESEHSTKIELRPRYLFNFQDVFTRHWAHSEIQAIGERGWMTGTASNLFSPNLNLTRAEAAVIIVRALQLEPMGVKLSFQDVNDGHWAKKEIEVIAQHEIMTGTSPDMFSPKEIITREQMAVILHRLFLKDKNIVEDRAFKDVQPNRWSYQAIMATSYFNIFYGFDNGTFKPRDTLSRVQMAVLMYRVSPYFFY